MPKPDYTSDQVQPWTPEPIVTVFEFNGDPRTVPGLQPLSMQTLKPFGARVDSYGQQISAPFNVNTSLLRIHTRDLTLCYYDIATNPASTTASTSISGETVTYVTSIAKGGGHRIGVQATTV